MARANTPASQKYEADGGPGMVRIAAVLGNSEARDDDIRVFLKAQIVFWMLRATDGHAKNFSLFLQAGDRYRMTPLYDVLSAWPVIGHGPGLSPQQRVKMAMAWLGDNRHYHADTVLRRHMVATAHRCSDGGSADALIEELIDATPEVIDRVMRELPDGFPESLAQAIVSGLRQSAQGLLRNA